MIGALYGLGLYQGVYLARLDQAFTEHEELGQLVAAREAPRIQG